MHCNQRTAALAALTLALCAWGIGAQPLPLAKPEQVGMSAQRLAKLGAALKKEADDGSFRGAVVMVARKGKLAGASPGEFHRAARGRSKILQEGIARAA